MDKLNILLDNCVNIIIKIVLVLICIIVLSSFSNIELACAILLISISLFTFKYIAKKISLRDNNILNKLNKNYVILIFVFAFVLRLIAIITLNVQPVSDFKTILDTAEKLKDGINIINESNYFHMWAYQTMMVVYQATILKIFNSALVIQIIDAIFTSGICVLIYILGNKIFNTKNIKLPSFLYAIYFYAISYTSVMSNQHIFTFLALLAINVYISYEKKSKYLISFTVCLMLGIANLFRTEAILIVLALICYEILQIKNKKNISKAITRIVIMLVVYFTFTRFASYYVKTIGLNNNGLNNEDKLWKFVCGSDYTTNGGYSTAGIEFIGNKDKEIEFIKNNYNRPLKDNLIFIKNKINHFWSNEDYYLSFNNIKININVLKVIINYDKAIYIFILSCCLVLLFTNKNLDTYYKIFILIILANFFVYLMIEIQPRYSYTVKIILFILATKGWDIIKNKFILRKQKDLIALQ